jgi:hypothetical protein
MGYWKLLLTGVLFRGLWHLAMMSLGEAWNWGPRNGLAATQKPASQPHFSPTDSSSLL